jgi:uncharacterized protein (TIGR02246 family)
MQAKQKTEEHDERAIRDLVNEWSKASEGGDLPKLLSLMADDVLFLVPNKEPFGKEAFAKSYEQMKGLKLKTDSQIQEIKVLGDWAWMHNLLKVTFTSAEGTRNELSGHVLTILHRQPNDNWQIVRDANLLTPDGDRAVSEP